MSEEAESISINLYLREGFMKQIIVTPTNHFKKRFEERWGKQNNLIEYLNKSLREGQFVKDNITDKGIVFPIAGLYVPLSKVVGKQETYSAITFLWNTKTVLNPCKHSTETRVQWAQP